MEEPYIVTDTLEAGNFRELGVDAVFTLSSAKPGSGVEQLRDGSEETYWYVSILYKQFSASLILTHHAGNQMVHLHMLLIFISWKGKQFLIFACFVIFN